MSADCHSSVRIQITPPDPLHCRRQSDRDRIVAESAGMSAYRAAVHEGRTNWEAVTMAMRAYHEELTIAAVRRQGGLGR